MAAINQPGSSVLKPAALSSSDGNKKVEEFTIRVPKDKKKTYGMMKLSSGSDVDFLKLSQTTVKMERENNLKEYKTANDLESAPKFGAGSEFGREQKEEARRKKYGIIRKKYNPEDQPWIMKIGSGKQARRYKGTREGTITDNTSYYIFTKSADGAFEAFPVEEWYNFTPMIRYKYLNSEEAEEEFKRRDHTLNLFSVMVRKRIKNDNSNEDGEEVEKKEKSKGKKSKSFLLTDMDEFGDLSDDDDEEEDGEGEGDDEEKPKKASKGKKGKGVEKRKKNSKHNSDDEAIEDSDEGDFDDREVDYMSDSSSSMSELEDRDKLDKYEEKGVDEEAGLKKLIDSEASSDEEEDKNKEEDGEQEDGSKVKPEKVKKEGSESSSSSSSDSDSDIEKEEKFSSVLFMQKKSSSRSATPTSFETEDKKAGTKRKPESEMPTISLPTSSKKIRTESPITAGSGASEGITEEAIRRYLMRKPMTAKELVQKFKSKKLHMTKEEIIGKILQLLKKIKPEKKKVNDKLYLSLPKTD
ncbi:hypothetical protein ACJMK2_040663 [Sinanodonta woodiana]|uniref:Transcription initiation factor IIF subunit alpha n=1 Tax=Sinanodonta woodiana TaxID=1069815 RepID=A0ABD3W1R0_SINWO